MCLSRCTSRAFGYRELCVRILYIARDDTRFHATVKEQFNQPAPAWVTRTFNAAFRPALQAIRCRRLCPLYGECILEGSWPARVSALW